VPTAFATTRELTGEELLAAPVRYPSPVAYERPLRVEGAKGAAAAEALGLQTVGDLLEHLPRDRREARTIAELTVGETATLVVVVKQIAARAVRRRGMRPLVEAVVADGSGTLRVTFFNQPWLAQRYPVGTRLMLHGRSEGRGRFTVQGHAPTDIAPGDGAEIESVAHYPATDGLSSTQILALVRRYAVNIDDCVEPLAAELRLREQLLDRPGALRAAHFARGADDLEAGRRRLAFEELLLSQIAFRLRRRRLETSTFAQPLDRPRELTGRWLARELPFVLTGDQELALAAIDADAAARQR
jgi:ATP-dependent DNA helicase RecG